MALYKFIKTKGEGADTVGYYVPHMYRFDFSFKELKIFGLQFLKERMDGWCIWYVENEDDFAVAIEMLEKYKKTHLFAYKVTE